MTSELETWVRRHHTPGGGDPFLFYVVYGDVDASAALSRSEYRSEGVPPGLDLLKYGPEEHAEVVDSFRDGYLWDRLGVEDPLLAAAVSESQSCIVLRGTAADDSNLNYLRDAIGLLTFLLDHGGCTVYDPQMFRWWHPNDWRRTVFASGEAVPADHVVILVSEEEDSSGKWFHTRGMRKFGRPDVSAHGVAPADEEGVLEILNHLIDDQAFGEVIPDGIDVHVESLSRPAILAHAGHLEDPEFNNVHIEVRWTG